MSTPCTPRARCAHRVDGPGSQAAPPSESPYIINGDWPIEKKIREAEAKDKKRSANERRPTLVAAGAKPRSWMSLTVLEEKARVKNEKLIALGEPVLTLPELLGARSYTGPLFVKYNSVLRGLDSGVPPLRDKMIQLCCAKETYLEYIRDKPTDRERSFQVAKPKVNTYSTTLHVINSSIVKLGKLTQLTKVYRGVEGMMLPDSFWKPNEYGAKGGIEGAFMSTSTKRDVSSCLCLCPASCTCPCPCPCPPSRM